MVDCDGMKQGNFTRSRLTILIDLDEDDLKALDAAIAASREGTLIPWETLRASLRSASVGAGEGSIASNR